MEFNSAKEAKDFYSLYSWEIGFGIRKRRNRVNDNNYTTRQDFVCSCEGICPNTRSATCRTGCKAMIRLHRTCDHGRVSSVLGVHGNQLTVPIRKEAVRCLCARIAEDNISDDIGKTISLLEQMKLADVGMQISFKLDEDGKIKSMLWCTGYCPPLRRLRILSGLSANQCQAMAAAIKSTLKSSTHRWCRWHVLRKTKQKVGPIYSKNSSFKKEFNKLVTEEIMVLRFERKWRQLMHKYNLENNQFMNRIFKHRAKWAKPYFMDIFCAGMTSTQRSESSNHMFKQFIQRPAPMHMFVRKFNEIQMDRNDQEEKEVHLTKHKCRKHRVGVPIERHTELIYTRRIYEKFYNELYYAGGYAINSRTSDGIFEVAHSALDGNPDQVFYKVLYDGGDKITCQCGLFEHLGLLCRHSLKVLVHLDVKEIPKNNIMPRWMKNWSGSDAHTDGKSSFELLRGSNDALEKRALVNRVLAVAYGPEAISEDVFVQAMGVMDLVGVHHPTRNPSIDPRSHDSRVNVETARSSSSIAPSHVHW
ncbi:protein FAR1-RELATED SEQUENCE 1-like [Miscanthus floridulus]|uniref:protein FAR1-RELATED SEQUENCE 1-like n=1 Tax=Miscanthus floridulus TaxID=154761 RepID=UPI00345951D2